MEFLTVKDQLICRSASFIVKCLSSGNKVVQFISRNGVYFRRMLFPFGRNAQFCCSFHNVPLCYISSVTKQLAWSVHYRHSILPEISKINLIKELLYVKYKMLSVSLLNCTDVDFMVEWLCTK